MPEYAQMGHNIHEWIKEPIFFGILKSFIRNNLNAKPPGFIELDICYMMYSQTNNIGP